MQGKVTISKGILDKYVLTIRKSFELWEEKQEVGKHLVLDLPDEEFNHYVSVLNKLHKMLVSVRDEEDRIAQTFKNSMEKQEALLLSKIITACTWNATVTNETIYLILSLLNFEVVE